MSEIAFDDAYFMKIALQEAQKAFDADEVPIGAIIVMNNQIIARAHNQTELLRDTTAHAEMLAITAASNKIGSKYLQDATLYVTIEPCIMCAGALHWCKIGRVVFGAKDIKNGFHKWFINEPVITPPAPFHNRTQIESGILAHECSSLIQTFFKSKRNNYL